MKYVFMVAYDGLDYRGWQIQSHDSTIAGALTDAFKSAFCMDAKIIGASRTDAGVHAIGQIASVETDLELDPKKLKTIWNGRLPSNIHIIKLARAPKNFHPLRNVVQKTYYYRFFIERPLPDVARLGYQCRMQVDIEKLKAALAIFVGTHDFRSFCTGDDHKNTIRTIDKISLTYIKKTKMHRITVQGKSFLRYMIRRIVGAALHCAMHADIFIDKLKAALAQRNAQQHFPTAEPQGLVLHKIVYKTPLWRT